VVDDYKPWQDFICSLIEGAQGVQIVGRASDGLEAVQKASELQPDVILLDLSLPTLNGIEAALQMRQCAPRSRILFVSENRDAEIADAAMATGAVGYVVKSNADKELLRALNALRWGLAQNGPYLLTANQRIVYEEIVDAAVALMRSDYASVQRLYPERGTGGELRLLAFRGFNSDDASLWEWVGADAKCSCGIALRDHRRVVAPDVATCDVMADPEVQQLYRQIGVRACQSTPLITRTGKVVGMISTLWRKPHQPSEDDFRLFDILAKATADVVERSRGEGKSNSPRNVMGLQ
jgi:DNA-binding NarL/FixJ family response regulator